MVRVLGFLFALVGPLLVGCGGGDYFLRSTGAVAQGDTLALSFVHYRSDLIYSGPVGRALGECPATRESRRRHFLLLLHWIDRRRGLLQSSISQLRDEHWWGVMPYRTGGFFVIGWVLGDRAYQQTPVCLAIFDGDRAWYSTVQDTTYLAHWLSNGGRLTPRLPAPVGAPILGYSDLSAAPVVVGLGPTELSLAVKDNRVDCAVPGFVAVPVNAAAMDSEVAQFRLVSLIDPALPDALFSVPVDPRRISRLRVFGEPNAVVVYCRFRTDPESDATSIIYDARSATTYPVPDRWHLLGLAMVREKTTGHRVVVMLYDEQANRDSVTFNYVAIDVDSQDTSQGSAVIDLQKATQVLP